MVAVVPPEGFAPVIHAALERGLHVFAEKPGAETAAEARSIADAADAAGVIAMVGVHEAVRDRLRSRAGADRTRPSSAR